MKIGIDLDGVCYDFTAAYCRYVQKDPATATTWEFYKDWGHTTEWFLSEAKDAIEADRLFRWGDLIDGTRAAFAVLRESGHTIHLVTDRCSLDPEDTAKIIAQTKVWLSDNHLEYDSIHFTGAKDIIVKELELDVFLDDKIENYEMVEPLTKAFLFDQPWNRDYDGARVHGWSEFVMFVTQMSDDYLDQIGSLEWNIAPGEVRVTSDTGGQKGQKMARLGSLDPQAILAVAMVAGFGEKKYSRLNYLNGYDWSLSFDALIRHLLAFWSGEDLDPESGLPHLAHAAWHCLCLLAFMNHGLGTDDRYKGEAA